MPLTTYYKQYGRNAETETQISELLEKSCAEVHPQSRPRYYTVQSAILKAVLDTIGMFRSWLYVKVREGSF